MIKLKSGGNPYNKVLVKILYVRFFNIKLNFYNTRTTMQIPVFQDERGNTIIGDISKQRNFNISCEFGGGGII